MRSKTMAGKTTIVTWANDGETVSPHYAVRVNGQDVFVHQARSLSRTIQPDLARISAAGGSDRTGRLCRMGYGRARGGSDRQ